MNFSDDLYMEQVINESGIKGSVCSKDNCMLCEDLVKCYIDASKREDNIADVNYGGYETEIHF